MLRIERELEEARGRLSAIRQAKYKKKGFNGLDSSDSEAYDTRYIYIYFIYLSF